MDVFSRMVIGWRTSTHLYTELALDALNMAACARQRADKNATGVIHYSGRNVQHYSMADSDRLDECAVIASVVLHGNSYDNALAETSNSLYKAEFIHHTDPRTGLAEVETVTTEYVERLNTRQLHPMLDYRSPVEVGGGEHEPALVA